MNFFEDLIAETKSLETLYHFAKFKEQALSVVCWKMKELSRLTRENEYFTSSIDDTFYLSDFRKYQWHIYGMLDILASTGIISTEEERYYHNNVRRIAYRYRHNQPRKGV